MITYLFLSTVLRFTSFTHEKPVRILNRVVPGLTTIDEMDAFFKPGFAMTGGHPMGRRLWHIQHSNLILSADGFDSNRNGVIADRIEIVTPKDFMKFSGHSIPQSWLLGGIVDISWFRFGNRQLLRKLHAIKAVPEKGGADYKLDYPISFDKYKHTVELKFNLKKGRLIEFEASSD